NAVVDLVRVKPHELPEQYREADPMRLKSPRAVQWLIHGLADDVVPANLSREYVQQKKANGEDVHLLEIAAARHFDVIDPRSAAWPKVEQTILHLIQA